MEEDYYASLCDKRDELRREYETIFRDGCRWSMLNMNSEPGKQNAELIGKQNAIIKEINKTYDLIYREKYKNTDAFMLKHYKIWLKESEEAFDKEYTRKQITEIKSSLPFYRRHLGYITKTPTIFDREIKKEYLNSIINNYTLLINKHRGNLNTVKSARSII